MPIGPRLVLWRYLPFPKLSRGVSSVCLPFAALLFACQPDDSIGPTEVRAPDAGSPRLKAEMVLARAMPPGVRKYREHAQTVASRPTAEIPLQLYQSLSLSIGEPTDLGISFENAASFANAINASGQLAGWTLGLADGPRPGLPHRGAHGGRPEGLETRGRDRP